MKAVLSNRIYLEVTREYSEYLKNTLTYPIPSFQDPTKPILIRNYSVINPTLMSIPIGRLDLIPSDYEVKDKRLFKPEEFPEFKFELRPSQQYVYDNLDDNAIINAKPSWGKAQPGYCQIRVRNGWKSMSEIKVGDKVINPTGGLATVTGKFAHKNKSIYEIVLADGRATHACGEHLWSVYRNRSKILETLTTEQILAETRLIKEKRIYLPLTAPVEDETTYNYIIHPYLLGFLLGDGGLTNSVVFSTKDTELLAWIQSLLPEGHSIKHRSNCDYAISSKPGKTNLILNELKKLNLFGLKSDKKFIPDIYKFSSFKDKLLLLQGLLDSDGNIENSGKIEFCSTSKKLMNDFADIIRSLGGSIQISSRITYYTYNGIEKAGKVSYRGRPTKLSFDIKSQLFRLNRKKARLVPGKLDNINKIAITAINKIENDDCYCISLDSENKLYLSDDYIVTHNTFTGLAIAGKLAQKTLIVVHTVPLRNQWANEVRKVYNFEPGIIGSSKFNTNSPIVVGNVQSLYNCMNQITREFGTIILDEMHHVSSPTFARVIDKSFARYKIGLSGTLKRKDGKDVVFTDYFGKNIFKPPPENSMAPEIHVVDSGLQLPEVPGGNWAQRINALMAAPEYQNLIIALAERYRKLGHKILIAQDRVEFAEICAAQRPSAVAITGNLKEGREDAMNRIFTDIDEIWGITSIFKEGISKDILSCLILAGPINNDPMLEQLIGRIQRIYPNKLPPIVVDVKLSGWTGSSQFQKRLNFYQSMGYKIKYL